MSESSNQIEKNIFKRFFSKLFSLCVRFFSFCKKIFGETKQDFYSKNDKTTFFLYCVLVTLLLALFAIFFLSSVIFPITIAGVVGKISSAVPFIWLASHVNKVINKRNKLYVEYEHKQIVMEFYVAFKDEMKEDPSMKRAFAKAVTDVVLRFPSMIEEAQDSDSPMEKVLDTFKDKAPKDKADKLAKTIKDVIK